MKSIPFVTSFIDVLREEFRGYNVMSLRKDVLAGINVAAVALPLSLAFGIASGASGAAGLQTAILAGLIIGLLSGIPNQVSGPTGAMSAVLLVVSKQYHLPGVWITTLLAGIIILAIGVLRLGRVVMLIPRPVINGFTSGIAIIIFVGQIHNWLGVAPAQGTTAFLKISDFVTRWQAGQLTVNPQTLLLAAIVVITIFAMPKRFSKIVPASLIGVAVATALALGLGWQLPEVKEVPNGLMLDPRLEINSETLALIPTLIGPAMSVAILCVLQALLSGAVCGNLTGRRMENDNELIAHGVFNIISPFVGGVPATGAVARTKVGIASGGQTRFTTIIHGGVLLAVVLIAGRLIERIPLAALAGVLIVTTIRMSDWDDIRWMFRHRFKSAAGAFLLTLAATTVLDLANAILLGVGLSVAAFVTRSSAISVTHSDVNVKLMEERGHRLDQLHGAHEFTSVAYVTGPLFFGSAAVFRRAFASAGPKQVLILSMRGVPLIDLAGLELIEELWDKQKKRGGDLLLCAMQPEVRRVFDRAHLTQEIGEQNFFWSADQAILAVAGRANVLRVQSA